MFAAASSGRSAQAVFSLNGQVLEITLSNTHSAGDGFQLTPTDVLAGLFFDIAGAPTLTAVKATLASQSILVLDGEDITASETASQPFGTGDVGAAWAYYSGAISGLTQQYALTAVGFGVVGPNNLFHPGSKLAHQQGAAPNGDDYGLIPSLTTDFSQGNLSKRAFIQSSAMFTLTGSVGSLDDIGNVRFQYGSSLSSPYLEATPEPSTWTLMIVGMVALAAQRMSRRRRAGKSAF